MRLKSCKYNDEYILKAYNFYLSNNLESTSHKFNIPRPTILYRFKKAGLLTHKERVKLGLPNLKNKECLVEKQEILEVVDKVDINSIKSQWKAIYPLGNPVEMYTGGLSNRYFKQDT